MSIQLDLSHATVLLAMKETCVRLILMNVKGVAPVIMGLLVTTLKGLSPVYAHSVTTALAVRMTSMIALVLCVSMVVLARTVDRGLTIARVWRDGRGKTVNCALYHTAAGAPRAGIQNALCVS